MTNSSYATTRLLIKQSRREVKTGQPLPRPHGGLRSKGFTKKTRPGKPLVTVVTVSYNAAPAIGETILSVIGQDYDNVEYLVIDGGSTDGTIDIIRSYEHAIDLWTSSPDRGIYDAMNRGIALGTGDWFSFMNAGDRYASDGILAQFRGDRFSIAEPGIVYGDTLVIDAQGREILSPAGDVWMRDFRYDTPICHQSVFTNRAAFDALGTYANDLKLMADLDWLVRFMKLGSTRNCNRYRVDRPIARYRIGGKGYSSGVLNYRERARVARRYFPAIVVLRYWIYFPVYLMGLYLRRVLKFFLDGSAIAYRWRRWRMGGPL